MEPGKRFPDFGLLEVPHQVYAANLAFPISNSRLAKFFELGSQLIGKLAAAVYRTFYITHDSHKLEIFREGSLNIWVLKRDVDV